MRIPHDLPLVSCELDSEDARADIAEFRAAAALAGWPKNEIIHAIEEALLACEEPSEVGDMLYPYSDIVLKSKYITNALAM